MIICVTMLNFRRMLLISASVYFDVSKYRQICRPKI